MHQEYRVVDQCAGRYKDVGDIWVIAFQHSVFNAFPCVLAKNISLLLMSSYEQGTDKGDDRVKSKGFCGGISGGLVDAKYTNH